MNPDIKYFFVRLNPPRPTFPGDITEAEKAIMEEHARYWAKWQSRGYIIVYGPVLAPGAVFGIGVLSVTDEAQVKEFTSGDPALTIGLTFEVYPMRAYVKE